MVFYVLCLLIQCVIEGQLVMGNINCSHFCVNKHYIYGQDPIAHNIDILQHQSLTFMFNTIDHSATLTLRNACRKRDHEYIPLSVYTIPPSFTVLLGHYQILNFSNTIIVPCRVEYPDLSEVSEFNTGYC